MANKNTCKVISSSSTKGGVSKTTTIKLLSLLIKKEEQDNSRILIIDLCQNGDVSTRLGYNNSNFTYYIHHFMRDECTFEEVRQIDEETGIHFIPANEEILEFMPFIKKRNQFTYMFDLKRKLEPLKEQFDFVFLDTHPSQSDDLLSLSLIASDIVLIPTLLDYSSVSAMEKTIDLVHQAREINENLKYQVIAANVDLTKRKSRLKEFMKFMKEEKGIERVPVIPRSVLVEDADFDGVNLATSNKAYAINVMNGYREVLNIIKKEM